MTPREFRENEEALRERNRTTVIVFLLVSDVVAWTVILVLFIQGKL